MTKLGIVTKPTVTVVASMRMSPEGIGQFIEAEQLTSLLEKETAPITRLLAHVEANRRSDTDGEMIEAVFRDEELLPEFAGRFCYASWAKGRPTDEYNANIMESEHGSVLEHTTLSLAITGVSRRLTHELIRHRAGVAISQESQRYVDAKDSNFVMPPIQLHYHGDTGGEAEEWLAAQINNVAEYEKWQELIRHEITNDDSLGDNFVKSVKTKRANEAAAYNLPGSTETRLVWTANLRTLRHVLLLRGSEHADLEIRRLDVEIAKVCKKFAPTIFADIEIVEPGPGDFGVPTVQGKYQKP